MNKLTQSIEDYIESIYVLSKTESKIKSTHIAKMLNVSKPAVNKAMNELNDKGFIIKTNYSDIVLTEDGEKKGKEIYEKHVVLMEFLKNIGVSNETAEIDCCKLEHAISAETLACIKNILKKF